MWQWPVVEQDVKSACGLAVAFLLTSRSKPIMRNLIEHLITLHCTARTQVIEFTILLFTITLIVDIAPVTACCVLRKIIVLRIYPKSVLIHWSLLLCEVFRYLFVTHPNVHTFLLCVDESILALILSSFWLTSFYSSAPAMKASIPANKTVSLLFTLSCCSAMRWLFVRTVRTGWKMQ
jgi:hypothetical protein